MKILITTGGTSEKIDQVRRITNFSTGKTGYYIASQLQKNYEIIYLRSLQAPALPSSFYEDTFETSNELEEKLKNLLNKFQVDIVIQCAAVSDFVVDKVVLNGELFEISDLKKIDSRDSLELVMKSRPKIITQIKNMSTYSQPLVIGFKLTNSSDFDERKDAIFKLSMNSNIDFVVHNDLSEISDNSHKTQIYFKDKLLMSGQTKHDLVLNLEKVIRVCSHFRDRSWEDEFKSISRHEEKK